MKYYPFEIYCNNHSLIPPFLFFSRENTPQDPSSPSLVPLDDPNNNYNNNNSNSDATTNLISYYKDNVVDDWRSNQSIPFRLAVLLCVCLISIGSYFSYDSVSALETYIKEVSNKNIDVPNSIHISVFPIIDVHEMYIRDYV